MADIVKKIPKLSWTAEELAEKLSLVGHETVAVGESLDVTLTANRKDCQQLPYLVFDLLALYPALGSNVGLVEIKPGKKINVTLQQVNNLLGSAVTKEQYSQLLRLGFIVTENQVTAPDFRVDVFEAADIAEEVFRLVGVTAINISMLSKEEPKRSERYQQLQNIRAALVATGVNEVRSLSFTASGEVALKNPFSADLPYLRANLLDGLLQTLAKNPSMRRAAFFEIGSVFNPDEQTNIGLIFSADKDKSALEEKLKVALAVTVNLSPPEAEHLHRHNVKQPNVFYGELSVENAKTPEAENIKTTLPNFKQISKFPPLVRDVTITGAQGDNFALSVHEQFPELLFIELVDTYTDTTTNLVSNTYRLIFQKHDDSFTQEEIAKIDAKIDQHFFKAA